MRQATEATVGAEATGRGNEAIHRGSSGGRGNRQRQEVHAATKAVFWVDATFGGREAWLEPKTGWDGSGGWAYT